MYMQTIHFLIGCREQSVQHEHEKIIARVCSTDVPQLMQTLYNGNNFFIYSWSFRYLPCRSYYLSDSFQSKLFQYRSFENVPGRSCYSFRSKCASQLFLSMLVFRIGAISVEYIPRLTSKPYLYRSYSASKLLLSKLFMAQLFRFDDIPRRRKHRRIVSLSKLCRAETKILSR